MSHEKKMQKTKSAPSDIADVKVIPTISEDSSALGEIKINHKVVANIVQLATLEVKGVVAVIGSNIVDRIEGIFSKKDLGAGIRVEENENGHYVIVIQVILSFGVELAKTAFEIQKEVRDHVQKMTNKQVAKVDVVIEEVKMPDTSTRAAGKDDWQEEPHTD